MGHNPLTWLEAAEICLAAEPGSLRRHMCRGRIDLWHVRRGGRRWRIHYGDTVALYETVPTRLALTTASGQRLGPEHLNIVLAGGLPDGRRRRRGVSGDD